MRCRIEGTTHKGEGLGRILDPPRSGCNREVVDSIINNSPGI
ncbi:MAG: hypothetical protein ABFD08_10680 [Syntrophomonas sp.]